MIFRIVFFLLLFFASVVPADAARVVMFYTDSRGCTGNATNFPTLVDQARSDFTVCNKCKSGRTSGSGVVEFSQAYGECAATGEVSDVVILLGVADMLYGSSNASVVANLHWIADAAVNAGSRAWIMTEPPGPRAWGKTATFPGLPADRYTRDNVILLNEQNGAGPTYYPLIRSREELGVVFHWVQNGSTDTKFCSSTGDGELHPTREDCRQAVFANPVIEALP